MRAVGVLLGLSWLAGCGGGDSTTPSPPALSYNGSQPFPAVVGEAIALTPAVDGTVVHYAVSPPLPAGLRLDERSGVISGTPTNASKSATFEVNATTADAHTSAQLVLSVTEPPADLSYPSPLTAAIGTAVGPLSPRITGTVEHFAVSPTLPPGIILDGTNGILSGKPSEPRSLAPYTITASSFAGNARFVLLLTVTSPRSNANSVASRPVANNRQLQLPQGAVVLRALSMTNRPRKKSNSH